MSIGLVPRLIGLDWGTSSLRAYLLGERAQVLEERARPWGVQHTPGGDFAAAFAELVGDWRQAWPGLPAVASGMIGSRQGWREVPYVACPAGQDSLAEGLLRFDTGRGDLHLVPGVMQGGALPNVLRGEETQVIGAMALEPALAEQAMLVLPGTHSKWASVREGRLCSFATYMTGELYAVLRDHSILGRPAREGGSRTSDAAFAAGLVAARDAGAPGLSARLFTARSLVLAGALGADESLDYLSGLLIGEELRSVLAGHPELAQTPLVLLGDAALCARYEIAFDLFGLDAVRRLEHATVAGLWRIAEAAGLLAASFDHGAPRDV